jgi:hypothetical protein
MNETPKNIEPKILNSVEFFSLDVRLLCKKDINSQQKILLTHVISMLNYNPNYFATNSYLQFALGLNQKTISKAFGIFEDRGWMDLEYTVLNVRVITINDAQKATLLEYIGTQEEYVIQKKASNKKYVLKKKKRKNPVSPASESPQLKPIGIKVDVPKLKELIPLNSENSDAQLSTDFGKPDTLEYFVSGIWIVMDKPLDEHMKYFKEYDESITPELIKKACEGEDIESLEFDFRYKQAINT